jgi:hypothetical protein
VRALKYVVLFSSFLALAAAAAPGIPFPAPRPAETKALAVAKAALAGEMYGADGTWSQASLPLGRTALLMRVGSGQFCGDVGCPMAVLLRAPGGWTVAWTGMGAAKGSVLASVHNGLHDIALNSRHGQFILRFDGRAYVEGN